MARKADILFAHNFSGVASVAFFVSKFFKKKLIVKLSSDYAWEAAIRGGKTFLLINDFQKSKKSAKIGRLHRIQANLCKKAELVIVPSVFLENIAIGWGVDKEKIKIIPEAIDIPALEIGKEEARKKINISGNLLISVGRLMPWEGFRMLIKIMPQLLKINQFFRLVIVGDGPERNILQAMIKNLGLDRKVYLAGQKSEEELAYYMAAADICILNTSYTEFPSQALGAMASGTPVITTVVAANKEIIKQGENGFMVKYNDEFNLIEAIRTVWQTPELQERFIEEGKKTAARFNSKKILEETIALLISNL